MGFFSRLAQGLKNTKKSFFEKLKYVFTGNDIDEDFFEELEYILISADIGTDATKEILERLRAEAKSRKLKTTDECKDVLKEMVYIGLPSGIQSAFFSISNVIVQKSVNGFGSTIIAGNSTASKHCALLNALSSIIDTPSGMAMCAKEVQP